VILAVPETDHPMLDEMRQLGFRVETFPLVPTWRRLFDVRRGLWVRRLVLDNDVDLVHTHLINADAIGWMGARLSGRPVVTTLHGPAINVTVERSWPVRVFLACVGWIFARMDRRIAISPFVRRYVAADRGLALGSIDVVFNASDVARHAIEVDAAAVKRSLGIPDGAPVVSVIGFLIEYKRPMLFLEAAERVLRSRPDCHFLVIGHGPLEDDLRRRIEGTPLEGRARLLGHRTDVPELLHATDVLTVTARDEGFGRTMTEAMASSVPVVAFDSGSCPDIVVDGETGFVVVDADVDTMAQRLVELLDDAGLRERMGAASLARARDLFDVGRFVEETETILVQAASARRPRGPTG